MVKTTREEFGVLNIINFLVYVALPFLLLLAFCITIHEFGHFLVAKLFRIPVEKFSIGFGPPLFRKKIGETDFRIAYFPLGGYVKMVGEEEGSILKEKKALLEKQKRIEDQQRKTVNTKIHDKTEDKQKIQTDAQPGFYDAPIYKRVLVVFSGPLFNIISAFLVFAITFVTYGIFVNPYMKVEVEKDSPAAKAGFFTNDSIISVNGQSVKDWHELWKIVSNNKNADAIVTVIRNNSAVDIRLPLDADPTGLNPLIPPILGPIQFGGPAYKAGMKSGDRVLNINDQDIKNWYQMVEIVRKSKGVALRFVWQHNNEIKNAEITPAPGLDPVTLDTIGQINVIQPLMRKSLSPFMALTLSFNRSSGVIWLTIKTLYQLIIGKISRKSLGGPIAILKLSGESARWGFEYLLGLLALISINLGLINLFPIPALDGGHILIAIIETIRRKRFSRQTRLVIQQIGYAIILLLIIFVTFNDITR